ncbi:MAG: Ku protein [Clostridiales bacterium]|nr:Ku protein [Clostridiales bacterium]
MAHSYKGAISFGLVYIPITLSVSVKQNDIGFNMLDKNTMSRVKYKKTCVDCKNKEVKNEDIVKGYQYQKGKYVIFTDKDFEKIKSPKDKNIVIEQFVNLEEIDPIYFDKAYYVKPSGADKAFNVLLAAMEKEKKAGIAKTVLGTKETLFLIRAKDGKMYASTMYFKDEIQKCEEVKKSKIDKKELDLAINLINQMTSKFAPEKFKDEYTEKIKKAIKRKISGNDIVATSEKTEQNNVINLMDALQKSLSGTKLKAGASK